jgi:phage I-like protein
MAAALTTNGCRSMNRCRSALDGVIRVARLRAKPQQQQRRMPASLRKLYDANKAAITAALGGAQ